MEGAHDLVLLDLFLGGESSLPRPPRFVHRAPKVAVAIFTDYVSVAVWRNAVHLGARGVLLKSGALDQLSCAVQELLTSDKRLSMPESERTGTTARHGTLTRERQEILEALRRGLSYKEIAFQRGIATKTVEYHVHRIRLELDLPERRPVDWGRVHAKAMSLVR